MDRALHSHVASVMVGWKRVVLDSRTKNKEDSDRELEACLAPMTGGRVSSRHVSSQKLWTTAEVMPHRSASCSLHSGKDNHNWTVGR